MKHDFIYVMVFRYRIISVNQNLYFRFRIEVCDVCIKLLFFNVNEPKNQNETGRDLRKEEMVINFVTRSCIFFWKLGIQTL